MDLGPDGTGNRRRLMAEIVGAFAVPHTPYFPALVAAEGESHEVARLYAQVRAEVEAVDPDVILLFDSDHVNTFFLDNLPTFCIGVAPSTAGPNDGTPALSEAPLRIQEDLGAALYRHGVQEGFDLSVTQEFTVDHSILVPLHFLTPGYSVPIVPVFVNGILPPLPTARRCHLLGQTLAAAVAEWKGFERVAILASGSITHEVGGPHTHPGEFWGAPDPQWLEHVVGWMRAGEVDDLLNAATTDRMLAAGNVSGELLNWMALLGAVGDRRPTFCEPQVHHGHAFAAWRWDG